MIYIQCTFQNFVNPMEMETSLHRICASTPAVYYYIKFLEQPPFYYISENIQYCGHSGYCYLQRRARHMLLNTREIPQRRRTGHPRLDQRVILKQIQDVPGHLIL